MKKMMLAAAAVAAAAFAFTAQAQDDSTHRKVTVVHKTTMVRHTRTGPAVTSDHRRVVHRRIVRHRIVHRTVRHDAMNDPRQDGGKRVVTTRTTKKVVVRHNGY